MLSHSDCACHSCTYTTAGNCKTAASPHAIVMLCAGTPLKLPENEQPNQGTTHGIGDVHPARVRSQTSVYKWPLTRCGFQPLQFWL